MLMLNRALLPGSSYLDAKGTAVIGKKLADDLGLKIGDTLKVIAEKADYGMGFKKFRISGLFHTGLDTLRRLHFPGEPLRCARAPGPGPRRLRGAGHAEGLP